MIWHAALNVILHYKLHRMSLSSARLLQGKLRDHTRSDACT
jgi:hypothetical protein